MNHRVKREVGDDLFVARHSFAINIGGDTLVIQPGQLFYSVDPIYKRNPSFFNPPRLKLLHYRSRKPTFEHATSAPGYHRA